MFLLVPAYPGCPGSKAVKRSLLLLLLLFASQQCYLFFNECKFLLHIRSKRLIVITCGEVLK